MKRVNAVVGQVPEKFNKRKLPKLPLIIVILAVGAIGAYALIHSFADSSDPNLLFNGRFDDPSVAQQQTWIDQNNAGGHNPTYNNGSSAQFVTGHLTIVPDPLGSGEQVVKFAVANTDVAPATPTENPRAQLISPDVINKGDDIWVKTKVLLPSDFPSSVPGWMSLIGIYGPPYGGSGPWELAVYGNHFEWDRNGTYNYDVPWSMPFVKNQWTTILVHDKFDTNGSMQMWINGQQVTFFDKSAPAYYNPNNIATTQTLNMQTMDSSVNGGANSVRVAQYRQVNTIPGTVTTYFGPVIIGKTQAAVDAADAANNGGTTPTNPTPPTNPPPPADTTRPTVNLTSPTSGSNVSGQVALAANATDNTGVSKVEFYADGTLISTDTSAPYTATWDSTKAVAGAHIITVKAYDAANNVGTSSPVTVNTAAASTPAGLILDTGGFESGTLNNWNLSGVGDVVPTVVSDIVRNGTKSAKVILTGTQGRSELVLGGNGTGSTTGAKEFHEGDEGYYAFSIYVNQMVYGGSQGHNVIFQLKGDDQQSPALALQLWNSPGAASDGTPGGKGLWYSGQATGSDRFISPLSEKQWHDIIVHFKVSNQGKGLDQIYVDGKLVRSDTNVNTMNSDTALTYIKNGLYRNNGTITGTSDIRLDDGKLGTTYASVAEPGSPPPSTSPTPPVTPPDTMNPTVSFASPANNATVSGIATATANASDNVGVSKVELSLDGALKMTDTASPYNYSFDTKTLANGNHTLTAKAYDAAGNSSTSTITIKISNPDVTPPNAPAGLSATATNGTTVNLAWNASTDTGSNPSGVVKYNVLRNGVVIAQPTTTSYTDTTATAKTTYSYVVQAVDGAGNVSNNSNTASVTTPTVSTSDLLFSGNKISDYMNQSAPGAVSQVTDPLGSSQQVFKMVVKNTDVAPVTPTGDPRAQLLSPSILNNGDDFWWSSKVLLPSDFPSSLPSGGWFNLLEGAYGPPFGGSPPWEFEVIGNQLGWQRNGTYHYDVPLLTPLVKNQWISVTVHEKLASSGFIEMWINGKQVTFFPSGSSNNNPNNVSPTTHLTMQTWDSSNNGGANFEVLQSYRKLNMFTGSVTAYEWPMKIGRTQAAVTDNSTPAPPTPPTPTDNVPPTVPANVNATAANANQVNLTWTASTDSGGSGLAGYNVYRNGTKLNSSLITTPSYGDGTVTANASYNYTVEAVDGAGNKSAQSTAATVKTPVAPDTTSPTTPSNLTATAVSTSQVNLGWNASTDSGGSGLAGYNVYRNGIKLNQTPLTGASYSDTSVNAATTYQYQVQAVDGAGNLSGKTSSVSVTTPHSHRRHHSSQTSSGSSTAVALTVVGPNNLPVAGATVTIADQSGTTDRHGIVHFSSIGTGKQKVSIEYGDKNISKDIHVKGTASAHSPQVLKVSTVESRFNPVLLLVPIIALMAAGVLIFRPWEGRFAHAPSSEEPQHIVSSDSPPSDTAQPGHKLETPGTVYSPKSNDTHGDKD